MPSIYQLKPRFQALLRVPARWLAQAGVTANHVTIAAMIVSIAYGAALALSAGAAVLLMLLPAVLLFRMALNAIDGMLARQFGQASRSGFLLNEIGDVVSDAALYLPLALCSGFSAPLVVTLVVLALLTEFAGVLALGLNHARTYAGPFGKSDRAAFFGAVGLLVGAGVKPGLWLDVALGVGVLLSLATIINRAREPLGS